MKQKAEGEEAEADPVANDNEDEDGEKKDLDSDQSEPEEIKVPPKELTEIDRVNYVVNAIKNDFQIVPVGAFKMTFLH